MRKSYMDMDFYRFVSDRLRDRFRDELRGRTTLLRRMKQMKILKKVDLQQMVDRFNSQQEFIKEGSGGESVKPPAESIHNTWLSVFGITNDMLAISHEELEDCLQYLRAVELILARKGATGRGSPKV